MPELDPLTRAIRTMLTPVLLDVAHQLVDEIELREMLFERVVAELDWRGAQL